MLLCSSRLSLVFLRGFFGARTSQNLISCLIKGGEEACCAQVLGGVRFAQQGNIALWVSLTCVVPSLASGRYVQELCLAQLS